MLALRLHQGLLVRGVARRWTRTQCEYACKLVSVMDSIGKKVSPRYSPENRGGIFHFGCWRLPDMLPCRDPQLYFKQRERENPSLLILEKGLSFEHIGLVDDVLDGGCPGEFVYEVEARFEATNRHPKLSLKVEK